MHACLRRFINCAQIPIQSKTLQGVDTAIKPSIWDWGTLLFFQVLLVLWPATFMRFACTVGTILHQLRHTSSLWPCKVPKPRRRFRTTHLNSQSWDMATHRVLFLPEPTETNILPDDFQHQLNILLRWKLLMSLARLTMMLSALLLPSVRVPQSSVHKISDLIPWYIWHHDYTVISAWGTGVQQLRHPDSTSSPHTEIGSGNFLSWPLISDKVTVLGHMDVVYVLKTKSYMKHSIISHVY